MPVRLMNLADAWQDPEAWTGITRVGGQDLPGEVAGIVTFGELSIHGWDLARATQLPFEPDPEGVAFLFELVQQTFGSGQDAPRGPAFAPAVPVPREAPVFHQILGLLGRDPQWSED
ncbi:MAG TPA: TIGR03086 family metal-binding protein [Acidimicrobiales bacterium]|nr:TIGR03086 family metal-binding protein [Acidimicrobiales bacterium]